MALLQVRTGNSDEDMVYTVLIDKQYSNLSKILSEGSRRLPENDRITVVPGLSAATPIFSSAWKKAV